MVARNSWVIGSVRNIAYSVEINDVVKNITPGSYYLFHSTLGSLSLLFAMASAIGGLAEFTRSRRIKLSKGAIFKVEWTDPELAALLGFGPATLDGANSYIAPNVSPLLFSPGKPLLSELSPKHTLGISRPLAYYTMSPSDGSAFVVSHGNRIDQRFSATHVDIDRVYTEDKAGGEWVRWFEECPAKGYQFFVHHDVPEEAGSTTVIAPFPAGLGPYVWVPSGRAPTWDYRRARGFEWTDFLADVSITCRDAPDYP